MSFNDFIHEYDLNSEATSNIKILQVISSFGLDKFDIYLKDGPFSSDVGTVNLNLSKGTHRVLYINEKYFDSYGCVCPKKLSRFKIKRNGHCLYSEYKNRVLYVKESLIVQVIVFI